MKNKSLEPNLVVYSKVLGTLNLCLKAPDHFQNESGKSDLPIRRKRPKLCLIIASRTPFWTLSQYWMDGEREPNRKYVR